MENIELKKSVPVAGEYDVVVCGGGPAGFIAAIAAAREGVSVALIERYGFLGGMPTVGFVAPISVFNCQGKRKIGGIPWEFVGRLKEIGGAADELPHGNVSFDPEKYKLIAQRMVLEAGVTLYLHSYFSGCEVESGRISHIFINNKNGTEAIRGRYFIDCTGDADLAAAAGVPMQPRGGSLQPASLGFCMGGVDTANLPLMHHDKLNFNPQDMDIRDKLNSLRGSREIPNFGGPWYCSVLTPGLVLVNMSRIEADMADNREATHAECRLREDVAVLSGLLREFNPAFRNAYLISTAVQAGIRETRRICGVHTLTGAEYLSGEPFPDTVTFGCHPVDIHRAGDTGQSCEFLKHEAHIPYRSLIAEGFVNFIAAGRCFSADETASASARVQASCMGMGEAAGAAAGICCGDDICVGEVDIVKLREGL